FGIGADASPEVIHVTDARVGDVECAIGQPRIFDRGGEQVEELLGDLDGVGRCCGVDARNLARRLIGAHGSVYPTHLGEHRLYGLLSLLAIVAPELDDDAGAHNPVFNVFDPLGVRARGKQKSAEENLETSHGDPPTRGVHRLTDTRDGAYRTMVRYEAFVALCVRQHKKALLGDPRRAVADGQNLKRAVTPYVRGAPRNALTVLVGKGKSAEEPCSVAS